MRSARNPKHHNSPTTAATVLQASFGGLCQDNMVASARQMHYKLYEECTLCPSLVTAVALTVNTNPAHYSKAQQRMFDKTLQHIP